MGRGNEACKFLGVVFIFSLLIQGSCAAEANNKTNANLNTTITGTINGTINDTVNGTVIGIINGTINSTANGTINGTINDTVNGTISGTINGTISDTVNGTVIGIINGTVNGTINGIINSTADSKKIFKLILLLPILYGNFLFLSWMSRFFDKMNFCFVVFILTALLIWLLSFHFYLETIVSRFILPAIITVIFLIVVAILYEIYSKRGKENRIEEVDEINVIVSLHDMLRNFIIIFLGLMWPLILIYFFLTDIEYLTFYGERLEFPVYIIAASSIGVLSYLYLSVEETFCQLIPEFKKLSIAWSYLRRITIAPFIALIGFYLLNYLRNIEEVAGINDYFVFIFSFFAGVFTKTIEEWIYAWVQKLLPGDKKEELSARTGYAIKESEFVKELKFDEDLVYALYNAKIRTIEELAVICDDENLRTKLNLDTRNLGEKVGYLPKEQRVPKEQRERIDSYSKEQVKMYINKARTYMDIDKSELVRKLDMDKDLAFKLQYFTNIKTIEDLKNCDPYQVREKICDCKKEAEELAKREKIDIEKARERICVSLEEKIKKFKNKAKEKLEEEKLEKEKLEKEKLEKEKLEKEELAKEELAKEELKPKNNMVSRPESGNKAENNTEPKNTAEDHSYKENEDTKKSQ